jgi:hypothetical protein
VQDDKRMEVWIHREDCIPYLSSPASGRPSGTTLGAHTARSLYPGTDKGAQDPLFSQRWSTKRMSSVTETKRPAHPVCTASHRFENHGHDCLGPRDFRYVVTAHGELQHITVPPGASSITASHADRGPPHIR